MIDWQATLVVLAPAGTAAAFVWRKIEARFKAMERKLDACERHRDEDQDRREKHVAIIELLWQEVDRIDPDSRTLKRCKHLLDQLKRLTREAGEVSI